MHQKHSRIILCYSSGAEDVFTCQYHAYWVSQSQQSHTLNNPPIGTYRTGISPVQQIYFRKTSKLSRNVFWTSWDHLGAQKSHFKKKKSKKVANTIKPPPLFTYLRDIVGKTDHKIHKNVFESCISRRQVNRGGLIVFATFFDFFFLKCDF